MEKTFLRRRNLKMSTKTLLRFNGPAYIESLDQHRLTNQNEIIKSLMIDGEWRTLSEIESITRFPQSSISAQLRHLRKERFGGYVVNKRRRGERSNGLFEYRISER